MNKTLQWVIGIGVVIITLAVVFLTVMPFVAPNLGWAGYRMMNGGPGAGMMDGYGPGMMGQGMMFASTSGAGMGMGPGMMGRMGYAGGGMMGAWVGSQPSSMHTAMLDSLADKLALSRADLDKRLAAGETLTQIANAQGINSADLAKIVAEARQAALAKAVADGSLTQAQAETMAAMMANQVNCPFASVANP